MFERSTADVALIFHVRNVPVAARSAQKSPASVPGLGAYEMSRGDQKDFTANGWKVGIAVLEVTDTEPVLKVADDARLGSGDGLTIFF